MAPHKEPIKNNQGSKLLYKRTVKFFAHCQIYVVRYHHTNQSGLIAMKVSYIRVIKTHDSSLAGYRYCIQDKRGNIISVCSSEESRKQDFLASYEDGDKMVNVIFDKPKG